MNCTLRIEPDEYPANPRKEFDNLGTMVCFHSKYDLGDKHDLNHEDFSGWDEMEEYLRNPRNFKFRHLDQSREPAAVILPLYLYDHSGLTMNTTGFSCPWDSGQVGFIYMTRPAILANAPGNPTKTITPSKRGWAERSLRSEVEVYDQYLKGDVWGYIIEDETGNVVDSCCGFYGEKYCREEGEASLRYHNNLQKEAA